ncbi:hypothetical protein ACP70R_003885 [Stipagrostis hirtigluma subsp. patula]
MVGTETAIVSAVISGTLKVVGNKLAPLLIKEYSSIVGVKDDLLELSGLVQEINWWLETAGERALEIYPSFNWLKQLKDVSYDVDDLVDEFHLEAEKYDEVNGDSGRHSVFKYLRTKPKSFMFQCKAAHRLKAIKKRFAAIVKQRTDYSAIANSVPVGHHVYHIEKTIEETPSLPIVNTASVIGRDQEKQQIIAKLVENNDQQEIKVVSIIGLGGSGKTTLAKLVSSDNNVINHFEVRLWVYVSQEFVVEKIIKKLFEAFADNDPGQHALPYMSKTVSDKLTGKRFLLVLDDVWTESRIQWDEKFMVHLQKGAPGSRILLTTRSRRVAEALGSTEQFGLSFLSPSDSWLLFEQSLFMPKQSLEYEFLEVGKEIVKKCGGVPLAIKVLAGALRGKERIKEWQAMRDTNLLDVNGEEHSASISACLRLSYFHLPSHLKQCFIICSVLPKSHEIDKEQLIDLWIAHDMITPVAGADFLEYNNGHKYFNSLVQMSFLQDVVEYNGRVRCRMHDLVHDLARSILGDEISFGVPHEAASSTKRHRYFSLTGQPRSIPPENIFEKARGVYVGNGDYVTFGKSLSNTRHLRSITVSSVNTEVLTTILQRKYLRYLCIQNLKCEKLPEAVSDIWSLQALHVAYSDLAELPKSIGKLRRLRTLNLSFCGRLKSLPDSIGDCHMISIIDLHNCSQLTLLPNSIGRNRNLRVLRLGHTKLERLPPAITTLAHLECLDLKGCVRLLELPDGIGNLKNLEILDLDSCVKLGGIPVEFRQLTLLQKLSLFVVGEGTNSAQISELRNAARIGGNLTIRNIARVMDPDDAQRACLKDKRNLQRLELVWRYRGLNTEKEVNIEKEEAILDFLEPPSSIEVLKMFGYAGGRYALWMLNQVGVKVPGAPCFPCLTVIRLSCFPNLKHLHGIMELPCLKKLKLKNMPALESICAGPFPSMVKLTMKELPSLGEVWMVTERTALVDVEEDCSSNRSSHHLGPLQIGISLSDLKIQLCPKLEIKPYLPSSLQHLWLSESNGQLLVWPGQGQGSSSSSSSPPSINFSHLKKLELCRMTVSLPSPQPGLGSGRRWGLLQHMTALESLVICECGGLTELPESIRSLTSLQSLSIGYSCGIGGHRYKTASLKQTIIMRTKVFSALLQLPEWLGELCSLRTLKLQSLPSLNSLPQSLRHLTSLQELAITSCDALHQLPDRLGELRSLHT